MGCILVQAFEVLRPAVSSSCIQENPNQGVTMKEKESLVGDRSVLSYGSSAVRLLPQIVRETLLSLAGLPAGRDTLLFLSCCSRVKC